MERNCTTHYTKEQLNRICDILYYWLYNSSVMDIL